MFQEVYQSLDSITSLSDSSEYTLKEQKFIKTLNCHQVEKLINIVNTQSCLATLDKEYCLYKLTFDTLMCEFISEINQSENKHQFHIILNMYDTGILLNILSPVYLCNYILDHQTIPKLFIPILYECESMSSGHMATLMIDNITNKIYMVDPNGKSDYFNHLQQQDDMNQYIEYILNYYTQELNKLGLNYKYCYITEWNPKRLGLNKKFENSSIGSGHCVIITLILIHLLTISGLPPIDITTILSELTQDEFLYLIKEYSIGICRLLG